MASLLQVIPTHISFLNGLYKAASPSVVIHWILCLTSGDQSKEAAME
jgi:hypothetical protein